MARRPTYTRTIVDDAEVGAYRHIYTMGEIPGVEAPLPTVEPRRELWLDAMIFAAGILVGGTIGFIAQVMA